MANHNWKWKWDNWHCDRCKRWALKKLKTECKFRTKEEVKREAEAKLWEAGLH
jgi:hypothetical protein